MVPVFSDNHNTRNPSVESDRTMFVAVGCFFLGIKCLKVSFYQLIFETACIFYYCYIVSVNKVDYVSKHYTFVSI